MSGPVYQRDHTKEKKNTFERVRDEKRQNENGVHRRTDIAAALHIPNSLFIARRAPAVGCASARVFLSLFVCVYVCTCECDAVEFIFNIWRLKFVRWVSLCVRMKTVTSVLSSTLEYFFLINCMLYVWPYDLQCMIYMMNTTY